MRNKKILFGIGFLFVIICINTYTCTSYGASEITKYRADDGQEFNSFEECTQYEKDQEIMLRILALIYADHCGEVYNSYHYNIKSALETILRVLKSKNYTLRLEKTKQDEESIYIGSTTVYPELRNVMGTATYEIQMGDIIKSLNLPPIKVSTPLNVTDTPSKKRKIHFDLKGEKHEQEQ